MGTAWSLIVPYIILANNLTIAIGLSMLLFGIVASAVVILSVYLPAFVLYVYPQLLTLIVTLFTYGDAGHNALAIATLVYLVMTTLFTRNVNRNLLENISLQVQNSQLIQDLGEEVKNRENVIKKRTLELQDKNNALSNEIGVRRLTETALRKSEERFELAMRGANDGVYDWNLQSNEIYFSPRWKRMLGYEDHELPNEFSTWESLIDDKDRERSWEMLTDYINGRRDNFHIEFKMQHKDGHWVDILSRAFLVRDAQGNAIRTVGTHVDISEKKRQEAHILRQAHYDGLTGLPNRFLAMDRLAQLLKEASRDVSKVAILFLDLDGFKRVNDTLGHETGDRLLVQAAERLQSVVREGDSVCRLGGDEFVVLLRNLGELTNARTVASSLISQFRHPFSLDERELVVTTSIGIAVYPSDGITPTELLRNADTAMYHSKEQGRNTFNFFTTEMNLNVSRMLEVEEQLHGAQERHEFSVVYQPVVELQSNRVVAAEALLRWNNPVLGTVSPDEFIPIAEQTGVILGIGRYVLQQAVENALRWREMLDHEFKIAINLSPRQFRDTTLVDYIKDLLECNGLKANALVLEVTEGVLMSGQQDIEHALSRLHNAGIRLAMDDFGTGYSSLNYLRKYPFDVLKVDRSFVNDLTVDPADCELVNASILMAHGLGLEVVAEGVETEDQLSQLRDMQCEYAQGYLFSRPINVDAFTDLLQYHSKAESSV
ncbi:MAG: EAL domain-containing protein [Candidatus Thiodiazotropha endolucinida]|nr:EAL domain-containing protein [Candidatus Thiodiazotropha taylori]MCG8064896.1 EAL domain-containing protein [Candidatus Thiodiazotropha taylori]MCW4330987.1 EAL domain-containing protein [Candidatus Thiodiazotropha endolucinida]MCW4342106.1 EAL domain-containing protein [Candidatus Thiodiazotropha endolucinida]